MLVYGSVGCGYGEWALGYVRVRFLFVCACVFIRCRVYACIIVVYDGVFCGRCLGVEGWFRVLRIR